MGAFFIGLRRSLRALPATATSDLKVQVIVPARNEALNIETCIRKIFANTYPNFEVIVANDCSTDETAAIVIQLQSEFGKRLHLLEVPENQHRTKAHKKRVIEKAVMQSDADIILTTDADCWVQPTWIASMIAYFDDDTAFVSGGVGFSPSKSLFGKLQALEFSGLVAIGAGGIGIGQPNMCNGANVAYRRAVFLDIKGFDGIDHLTSGDDELLMQKIHATGNWKVRFNPDPAAFVETAPLLSLKIFLHQRRRWASKGGLYPSKLLVATIVGIYLFHLFTLVGFFLPALQFTALCCFLFKWIIDFSILWAMNWHFNRLHLLKTLPLAELLQLPYVVIVGAWATQGGYEWKGRNIHR